MTDVLEHPTRFAYLGERRYIHSTTIFAGMRESLAALAPELGCEILVLGNFKVAREVTANGRFATRFGSPVPGAAAALTAKLGKRAVSVSLLTDDGRPVDRRAPGGREKTLVGPVAPGERFCGTVELIRLNGVNDFFTALVEANKQVHQRSLAAEGRGGDIRYGYLANCRLPPDGAFGNCALTLDLTCGAIREVDGRVHTVNSFATELDGRPIRGQISFNFLG